MPAPLPCAITRRFAHAVDFYRIIRLANNLLHARAFGYSHGKNNVKLEQPLKSRYLLISASSWAMRTPDPRPLLLRELPWLRLRWRETDEQPWVKVSHEWKWMCLHDCKLQREASVIMGFATWLWANNVALLSTLTRVSSWPRRLFSWWKQITRTPMRPIFAYVKYRRWPNLSGPLHYIEPHSPCVVPAR